MELIYRNKKTIVLGLLPALVLYLLMVVYPILRSFIYGFYQWNGLGQPVWNGADNFRKIMMDPVFWLSFKNNMLVVVASVLGQIPLGLLLAVLLGRGKSRMGGFFRSVFFMPMVLSTVVVGLLWTTILNVRVGIVNHLLEMAGLGALGQDWLGNPKIAMLTVSMVIVWQFVGLYMVIFLAALQNVPEELNEAASIDGATPRQTFWKITLPMLWPTVMTAVVLCISGSMRSFDLVFVMTQGGPGHATELMATYMYNMTFSQYKYGYGSAVSLVIFVISFGFILISRTLMGRKKEA